MSVIVNRNHCQNTKYLVSGCSELHIKGFAPPLVKNKRGVVVYNMKLNLLKYKLSLGIHST